MTYIVIYLNDSNATTTIILSYFIPCKSLRDTIKYKDGQFKLNENKKYH